MLRAKITRRKRRTMGTDTGFLWTNVTRLRAGHGGAGPAAGPPPVGSVSPVGQPYTIPEGSCQAVEGGPRRVGARSVARSLCAPVSTPCPRLGASLAITDHPR